MNKSLSLPVSYLFLLTSEIVMVVFSIIIINKIITKILFFMHIQVAYILL